MYIVSEANFNRVRTLRLVEKKQQTFKTFLFPNTWQKMNIFIFSYLVRDESS